MTFEELIKLCKPIDVSGPEPKTLGSLTQDSREVGEGSVFIAVKGTQVDGHLFIENAISKGASVIICEDSYYSDEDVCIIEVANTRSLVGPLAQAFEGYPAKDLKIIGITGTNGKTTVATLTYQLLREMGGARPSLLGTVAKRIDDKVLDSLLTTADPIELAQDMRRMVDANSTHLVMEVSSHAIDQKRTAGINFDVAAFTNLSHDHLDYHDSLQEYAKTKKKLFDELDQDAWAVINQDDEQGKYIALDCPANIIDFSFKKAITYDCQITSNTSEGLKLSIEGVEFESSLVGTFNAYNVAEAIFICKALGYEFTTIARALKSVKGAAGRLERVEADQKGSQPTVLVDYAHTPDALENVLSTLSDLKTENKKLHVIFGCGGDRDKTKRPKMAKVAETYADLITVTSDNPRNEDPDAIISQIMVGFESDTPVNSITNRKEAIEQAIRDSGDETMILIAGKGHETYQEIKGKRYDFDDRKIAREALKKHNSNSKTGEVA
jgi:UDP-N-acetylmuramoyl-L-alanyl-D-glutamate--2,6-diaminopimelate ligase